MIQFETKLCFKCGLTKPIDQFYIRNRQTEKRRRECIVCRLSSEKPKKKTLAIYCIKSPSGKIYVGKDEYFPQRMKNHESIANNPQKTEYNSPIHRAIRKYGWKQMKVTGVDFNAKSVHELKRREQIWIWLTRAKANGYNQTHGGEGTIGFRHSLETRRKLSLAKIGKKLSPEHGARFGKWRLGKKHSDETRRKISVRNKGRVVTEAAKAKLRALKLGVPLRSAHRLNIQLAMQAFRKIAIPEERRNRIKNSHLKNTYEFTHENGQVVITSDVKSFAQERKLATQHLYHIMNGTRRIHKGWKGRKISP